MKLPFYYGEFEYPEKSGNWYKGTHTPIITQELYLLAQEKLKSEHDFSYGSKEFAFTRIITCGSCGSGITAQEKTKKQQNGNIHNYIYYSCTHSKDRTCRESYIREEDLVEQVCGIIERLEISQLGIQKRMKEEIKRFKQFQLLTQDNAQPVKVSDVDMKKYLKYILLNGTVLEKREVLTNIKTNLNLTNRKILV